MNTEELNGIVSGRPPKPRKWYNHEGFPIVPIMARNKANYYNTSGFSFQWLFLSVWTLDSPFDCELSLVASLHWGFGITAILPYLRIICAIPCPAKLSVFINEKFGRKSKHLKELYEND